MAQVLDFADRKTVGASGEGSVVSHGRSHQKARFCRQRARQRPRGRSWRRGRKPSGGTLIKQDESITGRCQQVAEGDAVLRNPLRKEKVSCEILKKRPWL